LIFAWIFVNTHSKTASPDDGMVDLPAAGRHARLKLLNVIIFG